MNINNSEHLVSALSNKEIKSLIIALKRFNDQVGPTNMVLMEKLVNGFFLSNELESEVIDRKARKDPYSKDVPKSYWGTANGKALLAEMEEGSTKAYSY